MNQARNSDGTFAKNGSKYKNIFDEIEQILDGVRPYPLRFKIRQEISSYSSDWYLSQVKKLSRLTTKNALIKNSDLVVNRFEIGGLYFYAYDPLDESKKTMSAYDILPLALPFDTYISKEHGPGVRCLNFHYLPYRLRFFLFAKLIQIGRMTGTNKDKKLILSYKLLKTAANMPEFAPCVHNYLYKNLKSPIVSVPIDQWKIAVACPNANFKKMSEMAVWAESFRKAMQRKI